MICIVNKFLEVYVYVYLIESSCINSDTDIE